MSAHGRIAALHGDRRGRTPSWDSARRWCAQPPCTSTMLARLSSPRVQEVWNTEDMEDTEDMEVMEDTEDMEDTENEASECCW